jgi:large subunit ribosomal protein L19e
MSMMLKSQKRIAAQLLKCSPQKVLFDESRLSDIKEAITKQDLKSLIGEGVIKKIRSPHQSRSRTRVRAFQRKRGRQRGPGSRKGKATARLSRKESWMGRIRLQRSVLAELRGVKAITHQAYRELYMKAKGGFFRSKRHLELYISEHGLKK